jgi:sugar/nucleoside kinase (ribokinase family)
VQSACLKASDYESVFMTEKKYDVFGVGNAIVDILAFVDEDFIREHDLNKGIMTLVDSERQAVLMQAVSKQSLELRSGGSAANTMIGIVRSGGSCFYTGKISRDPDGEFYRKDLLDAGVRFDVHPASEEDLPTGSCLVITTPDAERTMFTHLGVSTHLSPADIDEAVLKQCKMLYVEGYLWSGESTRQACISAFEMAKKNEIPAAFTFSDPFMVKTFRADFLHLVRKYADIVFANAHEAMEFAGTIDIDEAAEYIGKITDLAFITSGKEGAIVVNKGTAVRVAGFPVEAVDTNGAGDAFAAGVLFALTHGHTPEQAARWGNYVASRIVTIHGARLDEDLKDKVAEILS